MTPDDHLPAQRAYGDGRISRHPWSHGQGRIGVGADITDAPGALSLDPHGEPAGPIAVKPVEQWGWQSLHDSVLEFIVENVHDLSGGPVIDRARSAYGIVADIEAGGDVHIFVH